MSFFAFCFLVCSLRGLWLTACVPCSSWLLVKFCKAILDIKVIKSIEKGDLFVVRVSFTQRQGGEISLHYFANSFKAL